MKFTNFLRHLPWLLLVMCCGAHVIARVAAKYSIYESGRLLELVSLGHPSALAVLIIVPTFLAGLVCSFVFLIQLFTRWSPPRWFALIFLLIPFAWLIPSSLPIPSFMEGAVSRLQDPNLLADLSIAAAKEIRRPIYSNESQEWKRGEELINKAPFNIFRLSGAPRTTVIGKTLILDFGGSMSHRWGIAISGVKNTSPTLPQPVPDTMSVSKEVLIYMPPAL